MCGRQSNVEVQYLVIGRKGCKSRKSTRDDVACNDPSCCASEFLCKCAIGLERHGGDQEGVRTFIKTIREMNRLVVFEVPVVVGGGGGGEIQLRL
jgi:hypothetical protein